MFATQFQATESHGQRIKMATYTLWCDTFDSTNVAWTEVNATPYLQDTDTSWVETATRNLVEGFFEFAPSGDPGTDIIDSVLLYIETQQAAGGDDQIQVDIQATGLVLSTVTTLTPNAGGYTYQNFDVSALLNTWAIIDSAEIQLTSRRVGGTMAAVFARRAYLYVTYHAPPLSVTVKRTLDKTVRHNRSSGTIQYVRMPSAPYQDDEHMNLPFIVKKYGASISLPTEFKIQRGEISQQTLKPEPLYEEGAQEWLLTFDSKPSRNYWDIPLYKAGMYLVYQPALNEMFAESECSIWTRTHVKLHTGQSFYRPPELVGGYVAFHKTLRNNQFKTGKLFNLLLPKATDKNGLTTYGSYNRDAEATNILRIMLPQDFLNSADYPVTIDPTFGKTAVGGSESSNNNDLLLASKGTMVDGGTVVSLHYRTGSGQGGNIRMAVYGVADNALKISTGGGLPVTNDWTVFNVNQVLPAADYWVCGNQDNDVETQRYDNDGANMGGYQSQNYVDPFADPCSLTLQVYRYSFYGTYEVAVMTGVVTGFATLM